MGLGERQIRSKLAVHLPGALMLVLAGLLQRFNGFLRLIHSVLGLGRHVVFIVLGQHLGGGEVAIFAQLALRHHAFAFFEPILTMPPTRKVRFLGASPEAIWLGVKKKTRLLWKALSTRYAAMLMAAKPPAMMAARL